MGNHKIYRWKELSNLRLLLNAQYLLKKILCLCNQRSWILLMALNRKESRSSTSKVWFSLVLVVFLSITGVDFVVNSILYSHGLDFSYAWYIPYLAGLSAIMLSICFLVGWQSYIDTNSMNVALKRGSTLFFAHLGGLVDWMFFLIYNGGQVHTGEWTWMWQYLQPWAALFR